MLLRPPLHSTSVQLYQQALLSETLQWCAKVTLPLGGAALLLVFLHLLGLWCINCFGSRENVLALGTRRPNFSSLCLPLGCLVTIPSSSGLPSKQGGRAQIRKLGLGKVRRLSDILPYW